MKLVECLVISSHALTLTHEAKHSYESWKRLFVCSVKQLKELLLTYLCLASCISVST